MQEHNIEDKILKILKENQELKILDIAQKLQLDRHTVAKYLEVLRTKGLVVYQSKGKSKIWRLTDNQFNQLLGINDFISTQVLSILSNLDYEVSIQSKNYDIIWHNSKSNEGKCYEVLKGKKIPCKNCPSKDVFKTGVSKKTLLTQNGVTKTMISEPIKNELGEVVAVVELIKTSTSSNNINHNSNHNSNRNSKRNSNMNININKNVNHNIKNIITSNENKSNNKTNKIIGGNFD